MQQAATAPSKDNLAANEARRSSDGQGTRHNIQGERALLLATVTAVGQYRWETHDPKETWPRHALLHHPAQQGHGVCVVMW